MKHVRQLASVAGTQELRLEVRLPAASGNAWQTRHWGGHRHSLGRFVADRFGDRSGPTQCSYVGASKRLALGCQVLSLHASVWHGLSLCGAWVWRDTALCCKPPCPSAVVLSSQCNLGLSAARPFDHQRFVPHREMPKTSRQAQRKEGRNRRLQKDLRRYAYGERARDSGMMEQTIPEFARDERRI